MERYKRYGRNGMFRIDCEFKMKNEKGASKTIGCTLKERPCSVSVVLGVHLKVTSGLAVKDEGGDKKWP